MFKTQGFRMHLACISDMHNRELYALAFTNFSLLSTTKEFLLQLQKQHSHNQNIRFTTTARMAPV